MEVIFNFPKAAKRQKQLVSDEQLKPNYRIFLSCIFTPPNYTDRFMLETRSRVKPRISSKLFVLTESITTQLSVSPSLQMELTLENIH